MKKLFSFLVIVLLALSVMPLFLADGDDGSGDVNVNVTNPTNVPPVVYTDHTQRSWYPNDQTKYTAELYGNEKQNLYGDIYYDVSERGNYVFSGETVMYYVIIQDNDGIADINNVILQKDGIGVGSCGEITPFTNGTVLAQYGLTYNSLTMKTYRCMLIVQSVWTGSGIVNVMATDKAGHSATSAWSDRLTMNPTLKVEVQGAVNFGTVTPGTTATSNTVYINNVGTDGVVMDMYTASSDYFTDPLNPTAICGKGNGIPYTAFSYYATKGSVDSGSNNNNFNGLGTRGEGVCVHQIDEYTRMPSYSGNIGDMCRIINHMKDAGLLTQGQSMSMTFRLDVPTPCSGSFTNGKFWFSGRVV